MGQLVSYELTRVFETIYTYHAIVGVLVSS